MDKKIDVFVQADFRVLRLNQILIDELFINFLRLFQYFYTVNRLKRSLRVYEVYTI